MRDVIRRASSVLLAVALAGALTACGVRSTLDPVAAAATKTEKAGGYKVSIVGSVSSATMVVRMSGQGIFDADHGELDMSISNSYRTLGGQFDDVTMKTRYLHENGDPVMYMNLGQLAGALPNGKSWIRLDLEKVGQAMGFDLAQMMGSGSQNPTQSLDALRSSSGFTQVGTDDIDGVQTTHYHGVVDLMQAAKQNRGIDTATVKRLAKLGLSTQYPMDVWIGDDGLVRQYQMKLDESVNGKDASIAMIVKMSDFGTTVDVTAPAADDVIDMSDAAAAQSSSGSSGNTA